MENCTEIVNIINPFSFPSTMKVTIDTKEDSQEDIQQVLHILQNMLKKTTPVEIKETETSNLMSMFSQDTTSDKPEAVESKTVQDTPPDFTSLLQLTDKEEPKLDPKIEYF
jgi:hypothetical protein